MSRACHNQVPRPRTRVKQPASLRRLGLAPRAQRPGEHHHASRDLTNLLTDRPTNVVLLKISYWLSL